MKQVLLNLMSGEIEVEETPSPKLNPDGGLIRTRWSLITVGLASSLIDLADSLLFGKVRHCLDLAKKVTNKARQRTSSAGFWRMRNQHRGADRG